MFQTKMSIHMEIKRQGGAKIEGPCEIKDRRGSVICHTADHGVSLPYDGRTGRAGGRRDHSPSGS